MTETQARQAPQYRAVLARNLAAERTRLQLTTAELAARMAELGFTKFVQQTISQIELERRRISAEEILGFAVVLGVPLDRLIYPPADVPEVSLPGGEVVIPNARPPRPLRSLREAGEVTFAPALEGTVMTVRADRPAPEHQFPAPKPVQIPQAPKRTRRRREMQKEEGDRDGEDR